PKACPIVLQILRIPSQSLPRSLAPRWFSACLPTEAGSLLAGGGNLYGTGKNPLPPLPRYCSLLDAVVLPVPRYKSPDPFLHGCPRPEADILAERIDARIGCRDITVLQGQKLHLRLAAQGVLERADEI